MRLSDIPRVRARTMIATGCVVTIAAGLVVAGLALTPPPVRPHLLPGDIWLTSRAVGQITLVSGVSAAVSAGVAVTGPDGHFDAQQSGRDGYAVTSATGQVVGVSDATLQKTATTLSGDPTTVYVGTTALFAVIGKQRAVQLVQPETFARIGRSMALPAANPALATDGRTLWAADGPTGILASYTDDNGTPTRHVDTNLFPAGESQPRLAIADGEPALVDPAGRTAYLLTSTGDVTRTMRLDLRPGDIVSGAADASVLDIVEPDHGLLTVCDFGSRTCQPSIPLTGLGHHLGAAVQTAGHVFVADYTTGVVRVVDLATKQVRRTEPLFDHPIRFELLQRDHIVYFNDPDGEKAGVVTPGGQLRRVDKYDPRHPSGTAVTTGPHPTNSGPPTPSALPVPTGAGHAVTAPKDGPAAGGGSVPATTAPNQPGPHIVVITTDPPTPQATRPVTFSAQVSGMPTGWAWTVTDPSGHEVATSATTQLVHTFSTPGVYEARLTVTAGTLHDTQSVQVTVIPYTPPVHCGDTVTVSVVLTADLTCAGIAITVGAPDITIDLGGHTVRGSASGITNQTEPDVTIKNGTISGGMTINGGASNTVSQIRVDTVGIAAADSLKIEDSTLTALIATAANLSVIDTKVGAGGLVITGRSPFVSGCTVVNSGIGFQNASGPGFAVLNNTFVNSGLGFGQSDEETISGNTFRGGGGIFFQESHGALVENNNISGTDDAFFAGDNQTVDDVIQNNVFDHNKIGIAIHEAELDFVAGIKITGNTFTDNSIAGVDIEAAAPSDSEAVVVSGNRFVANGGRTGGATDPHGYSINDGLHIDVPAGSALEVTGNITQDNAEYGIEAQPGTVRDGGGNTSQGDPKGCLGVRCG